jgi:hypothetical protein
MGTSSFGQRGKNDWKRPRLTSPCNRLTPFTAPLPAQREISHIELLMLIVGMFASKRQHVAEADVYSIGVKAQILRDQIRRETIEAGWHRRVRGKDVARTSRGERNFERLPESPS